MLKTVSKYFTYTGDPLLACPHCGDRGMVTTFLDKMDSIREDFGRPLVVSSGYRCSHYNSIVSSTGKSGPHTTGRAMDVLVSGEDAYEIIALAPKYGITGIGVSQKGPHNKRFLHLDDLKHLRPWVWSY